MMIDWKQTTERIKLDEEVNKANAEYFKEQYQCRFDLQKIEEIQRQAIKDNLRLITFGLPF
ncbi:hypothetical protein X1_38 [Yersinia phage vB_Yen_X1]|nr:hypothetical protein X1_38 [Yersinia phage vB_Yen_X1]